MIENFRQRNHAQKQLAEWHALRNRLTALTRTLSIDDRAMLEQVEIEIANLKQLIEEYDALIETPFEQIDVIREIPNLPKVLLMARISIGTQHQLASELGIAAQQLNRWEIRKYSSITLGHLIEFSQKLMSALEAKAAQLEELSQMQERNRQDTLARMQAAAGEASLVEKPPTGDAGRNDGLGRS